MRITEISSAQNPRYKNWLKLLDGRGIKKQQTALIAGRKVLDEYLRQFPDRVLGVILKKETDAADLPIPPDCPQYLLPQDLFAALDIYGIREPILLATAPPLPQWDASLPKGLPDGITVFLPFQNPINLGTTIRSAAAFGASVVLLREAALPYLPKCLRASGPAIFQVPLFAGPSMAELASYTHLPIFALSPRGENLFNFPFAAHNRIGLVGGMEGPGLDEHWPEEKRLSIPMNANVESLNASVAMSIAMSIAANR
ncbi:MAG: 23S rRNA (guanosine-2'-O-)-methyltransferase RlmB [Desulfovibrio sp.]